MFLLSYNVSNLYLQTESQIERKKNKVKEEKKEKKPK